jgi:methylmalonyl-CoA mutase
LIFQKKNHRVNFKIKTQEDSKTSLKLDRLFFLMPEKPIHIILNQNFPKSTKEDWLRIASQELNEKNPSETLSWQIDALNFFSYYDKQDITELSYLQRFNLPPFRISPFTPGGWENLAIIKVSDEKKANAIALETLRLGAEGIFFDITEKPDVCIDLLMEKITWPFCSISFLSDDHQEFVIKIVTHIKNQNYNPLQLRGSIFWKKFPATQGTVFHQLSALKNFRALGMAIAPSSAAKEISDALAKGVSLMENLVGIKKENLFNNISISLPCGENFLMNIAKLKALRILWYQVSQAYEMMDYKAEDLFIHARSEKWIHESFQPHGNMLNNTYDAIASVLGECNAITLTVEDENNWSMLRAALHVSNILREEAHLDKVVNGIAGSYALENMVNTLAQEAWADFQLAMQQ